MFPRVANEPAKALVLGWPIDRLDLRETVQRCLAFVTRGEGCQHFSINVAVFAALEDDPELREVFANCEIVSADGQSIVWASRLLGDPLPERVPAPDLMAHLLAAAEQKHLRVFILGARQEVLERAVDRLRGRHPRLEIVGYRNGYFSPEEEDRICDQIKSTGADMLFVAITSPLKDLWLARNRHRLGVPLMVGVGGAIDVVAGVHRRAPGLIQRLGLEWAFRLLQEPRRLAPRYFRTNSRFAAAVLRELFRGRASHRSA